MDGLADEGYASDSFVPNIPCASVEDDPSDWEMMKFWNEARWWLADRGVNLYEIVKTQGTIIRCIYPHWLTPIASGKMTSLPYAVCVCSDQQSSRPVDIWRMLGHAQDLENRDIMIKPVDNGSDQHHVYQRLLQDSSFSDPATFPCVLPPLVIIDTPYNYSFVTMPKWGMQSRPTDLQTVREVLRFIECLLQGVVFLHERRIAHRDITDVNILVNCYRLDLDHDALQEDLREHRKGDNVYWTLMDYDQSIALPLDTCLKTCRRPSEESQFGDCMYKPWDTGLGKSTYNPFAFDVGMLGNLFRFHLSEVVPTVPAFAALFDKMTTHVVPQRFTAEEALQFFKDATDALDEETLHTGVELKVAEYLNGYWDRLSPALCRKWGRYKTPPESWFIKLLDRFASFQMGWKILVFVRRLLSV